MTTTPGSRSRITTSEIIGSVVVLALVLVFGRLCLWQVSRLHERRASNARIAARLSAPPIAGALALADTTGAQYRRIELHGTFDDDHSIILPGRSYSGSPGVHVLTPLLLDSTGHMAVLVNRGWVPSPDAATVDLSKVHSTPQPSIVGLVQAFPDRRESVSHVADSAGRNGEFKRVWYAIDEQRLRAQFPYPLASFMVQLLPGAPSQTFPKPIAPPPLDEGPHLSYAVQWFSFAVITLVGWIIFLVRRRSERSGRTVVVAPPHPPAF